MERLGIRYAVVGSVASSFYGEARFTNDVDIVAELSMQVVPDLLAAFPSEDFYISEDAVRHAIGFYGQFNVIHPESGLKLDIIIPDTAGVHGSPLDRRRRVNPRDVSFDVFFAAAEDVILSKLKYYREGGSDKHLRDIAGIIKVSAPQLSRAYIEDLVTRFGLNDEWRTACIRAGW